MGNAPSAPPVALQCAQAIPARVPERSRPRLLSSEKAADELVLASPLPRLVAGDKLQYFSDTHAVWIDCSVVAVRPTGEVEVSCKPGCWLSPAKQAARLRRPLGLAADVGLIDALLGRAAAAGDLDPLSSLQGEAGGSLGSRASSEGSARRRRDGHPGQPAARASPPPAAEAASGAGGADRTLSEAPSFMASVASAASSMQSLIVERGSTASLGGASAGLSVQPVGFDPGVQVVAFHEDAPPGKLGKVGRSYECGLEASVHVPAMWSFASFASNASASSAASSRARGHQRGQLLPGIPEGRLRAQQLAAASPLAAARAAASPLEEVVVEAAPEAAAARTAPSRRCGLFCCAEPQQPGGSSDIVVPAF